MMEQRAQLLPPGLEAASAFESTHVTYSRSVDREPPYFRKFSANHQWRDASPRSVNPVQTAREARHVGTS